jgi:hypothetical protein
MRAVVFFCGRQSKTSAKTKQWSKQASMMKWSGQSTCSGWCRLDAQYPSSCGKYRRVLRCPKHKAVSDKCLKRLNHGKIYIYDALYLLYVRKIMHWLCNIGCTTCRSSVQWVCAGEITFSTKRVAYMMVTSVCSKREWTHLRGPQRAPTHSSMQCCNVHISLHW